MIEKVQKYIQDNHLIDPSIPIVVGVSGGIDSMVLLHILKKLNYSVIVGHVHHNVRKESDIEYEFVKDYAKNLNVPFYGTKLPKITEGNFHQEARNLRYNFLFSVVKENKAFLATAHHLDDQVETIIMKILRGSNIYGYAGIKNQICVENIMIIRPLLCLTRKEISKYAQENNIPYMEDASNGSDKYTRNRIRHHLIPLLCEESDNVYQAFTDYSEQLLLAFSHIRKSAIAILDEETIPIDKYRSLDQAVKNEVIAYLLEKYEIENIKQKIKSIDELITGEHPNSYVKLSDIYIFQKEYDKAFVSMQDIPQDFHIVINDFGEYPFNENEKLCFSKKIPNNGEKYVKLCYNKLELPLIVRNRKKGDSMTFPFGNKKLKDFFIDRKVPLLQRDLVPIVTNAKGTVVGIIGFCPSKEMDTNDDPVYLYIRRNLDVK